ncbi:uncharacterized protein LOC129323111 [Prosopis cineraria]|uniref:uncharacterized protein LOC129323111 n=1 Tax=Prosopis cineraria TaxID=364024 RepID=UPI00240F416C|nr:uncharacterized protein LOC129323111 [Prosopis cineraria]
MVLWEITVTTAYFLGLKRTYRLALRLQRKIISPKHYKIRQFAQRRTRAAFDIALKVHRSIQERDIEVGRNVGNFILRFLDRMKPSAQIRGPPQGTPTNGGTGNSSMTKLNATPKEKPKGYSRFFRRDSDRHFFTSSTNIWPKPFPTIAMMMRPPNAAGTSIHYRRLTMSTPEMLPSIHRVNWSDSVVRKDILQWMQRT